MRHALALFLLTGSLMVSCSQPTAAPIAQPFSGQFAMMVGTDPEVWSIIQTPAVLSVVAADQAGDLTTLELAIVDESPTSVHAMAIGVDLVLTRNKPSTTQPLLSGSITVGGLSAELRGNYRALAGTR